MINWANILKLLRVQVCSVSCFYTFSWNPPFPHAFLQIRKQKLAVEGVDGGDVGEDVLHHIQRESAFIRLLHHLGAEHLDSHERG